MSESWPEVDVEEGLDIQPFDETALADFTGRVLAAVFSLEGRNLRLSVHFCSDAAMCALHEEWLGDPSSTDVMSFPLEADAPGQVQGLGADGELVVCIDHARAQARVHGNPFENEVALYLVHGALHLLGYDDHEPSDLMRMKASEARTLERLGLPVQGRHVDR